MNRARHNNHKPKDEWVRLYIDNSRESSRALLLLRQAGYCIHTYPVNGNTGPELKLDQNIYKGIREIEEFVRE